MSSIQHISEIIRFSVQQLKKNSKGNPSSQRNLLNKWFLDSIKNYFMEQYAAPLIANLLGCKTSQEVKERVHSKLDSSIPKYMSILFNYLELLEKYNKVQQFKSNLLDMIKDPINLLEIESSVITPTEEKLARKQFVGLMILIFCELRRDPEIRSFYDLWNFTFPNDIQSKKRNIKYSPKQKDAELVSNLPTTSSGLISPIIVNEPKQATGYSAQSSQYMLPFNKTESANDNKETQSYFADKFEQSVAVADQDSLSSPAYDYEVDLMYDNYGIYTSEVEKMLPNITPINIQNQQNQRYPIPQIKNDQNNMYKEISTSDPSQFTETGVSYQGYFRSAGQISNKYSLIEKIPQTQNVDFLPENEFFKNEDAYAEAAFFNLNQRVFNEEQSQPRYYQVFSANQSRAPQTSDFTHRPLLDDNYPEY